MENRYTTFTIQLNGLTHEQETKIYMEMFDIAHDLAEDYGVEAGDFVTLDGGKLIEGE